MHLAVKPALWRRGRPFDGSRLSAAIAHAQRRLEISKELGLVKAIGLAHFAVSCRSLRQPCALDDADVGVQHISVATQHVLPLLDPRPEHFAVGAYRGAAGSSAHDMPGPLAEILRFHFQLQELRVQAGDSHARSAYLAEQLLALVLVGARAPLRRDAGRGAAPRWLRLLCATGGRSDRIVEALLERDRLGPQVLGDCARGSLVPLIPSPQLRELLAHGNDARGFALRRLCHGERVRDGAAGRSDAPTNAPEALELLLLHVASQPQVPHGALLGDLLLRE
mmetsp:Transcript_100695/g.291008  ORF Transcript_100695/g.291008 Transcript_100695/m.291008 type:complete len:280 (-) Transcript_100695:786-1625(-)